LGRGTFRYFRIGYFLILLAPALSLVVFDVLTRIIEFPSAEGETLTTWNISILAIWIIGLTLYIHGYVRRETTVEEAKMILLLSVLLIPWAWLTYLFASGLLSDALFRAMQPEMSPLTAWDYLEYWTWELKAIFWIGSGLLLTATSLVKMYPIRRCTLKEVVSSDANQSFVNS